MAIKNTTLNLGPAVNVIAQSAIPIILVPSCTISAAGVLTGITALPFSSGKCFCIFGPNSNGLTATTSTAPAPFSATINSATQITLDKGSATAGAYTAPGTTMAMFSIVIPGGSMGANGAICNTIRTTQPNNANTKAVGITFGGVAVHGDSVGGMAGYGDMFSIWNRGTGNQTMVQWQSDSTAAPMGYSAVNTVNNQPLTITASANTASDYIIIETYTMEMLRSPLG